MTELRYEVADDVEIGRVVLVERSQKDEWLENLNAREHVTAVVMHEILISQGEQTLVDRTYLFVSVLGAFKSHSISGGLFVTDAIAAVAGDAPHELIGDPFISLEMTVATERKYDWLRELNHVPHVTAGLPDPSEGESEALTRIFLSVPSKVKSHSISAGLFLNDAVELIATQLEPA